MRHDLNFGIIATVVYLFFLSLLIGVESHADTSDYEIAFTTSDANSSESHLTVCNIRTRQCAQSTYKNKDLDDKSYDQDQVSQVLDQVDAK